jgi:hypothetical protein
MMRYMMSLNVILAWAWRPSLLNFLSQSTIIHLISAPVQESRAETSAVLAEVVHFDMASSSQKLFQLA